MDPILELARAEGFAAGKLASDEFNGLMRSMAYDEAYYDGQCDALGDAPSRFDWWLIGLVCGAVAAWAVL